MSKENLNKTDETYPLEDINETTSLTKPIENAENNAKHASGVEEKLSLEKDNEAAQTSNKKSVTAAFLAAEEILQNPKMRLILAIVGGALLFLFILVVCIVVNYTGDDDDKTYRFLRIIPKPRGPYNLIYYRHGDLNEDPGVRTWVGMVEEIETFLAPYRRPVNTTLCRLNSKRNALNQTEQVCLFDLKMILDKCLRDDFGYKTGQPCIFIVFNNILNWEPQSDSNTTEPFIVNVECKGNTQFDAENVGLMEFSPFQGFLSYYFPYKGQTNYMTPFIALQLPSVTHNVGIGLTCRILSKNLLNQNESTWEPLSYIPFNIYIE